MGTDDPGERDLHQGLIKLAAAFVHATRGNKLGIEKNLRGARELLAGGVAAGAAEGIDVPRIIAAIETGLSRLEAESALGPIPIFRTTGPTSC
jgi:predicted metal-dependent hydrolase